MPRKQLKNIIRHLFPPYGFKREQKLAGDVHAFLWERLMVQVLMFGFDFKQVPTNEEADALIEFVTASADVVSQSLGGAPGGHASINGTLFLYQSFLLESEVIPMMRCTLALHAEPSPAFISGQRSGSAFDNAEIEGDLAASVLAAFAMFPKHYRHYCSKPDGKKHDIPDAVELVQLGATALHPVRCDQRRLLSCRALRCT